MKEQLLTTLENSRMYTLAVAEAMPEKFYDFKPTDSVWTFKELLHHVAYGIEWWNKNNVMKIKADWNPPATVKDKKAIADYLHRAYDSLKSTIEGSEINDAAVLGVISTLDHVTHHRGQAVTYLRCKDIVAPEYSF